MAAFTKGYETIDERIDLLLTDEHYQRFLRLHWAIEKPRGFFPTGDWFGPQPDDPTILFMLEAAEAKLKPNDWLLRKLRLSREN
jgi:hypothetical protein